MRLSAARGRQMQEWAESADGLFAVFDAVRSNYLKTLTDSDIIDSALREQTYHRVKALDDMKAAMQLVIAEGAGADATIKMLSELQDKKSKSRA